MWYLRRTIRPRTDGSRSEQYAALLQGDGSPWNATVLEPMSPEPAVKLAGYSMVVWWLGTQLLAAQTFMSLPEAPSSSRAFCGVQAGKTAWQAVGHVFAPATGYPLRCEIRRLDVCIASAAAIAKISKTTPLTRIVGNGYDHSELSGPVGTKRGKRLTGLGLRRFGLPG